jgi:hypothetical protein
MWALIISFLAIGGLVRFAYGQKEEPTLQPALRKAKLIRLANIPVERLTIDQAEDGIVLSRQFDVPELGRRFRAVAEQLKKIRQKGSTP